MRLDPVATPPRTDTINHAADFCSKAHLRSGIETLHPGMKTLQPRMGIAAADPLFAAAGSPFGRGGLTKRPDLICPASLNRDRTVYVGKAHARAAGSD
jgi:hypothetical protein